MKLILFSQYRILPVIVSTLMITACGGGGGSGSNPPPPPVEPPTAVTPDLQAEDFTVVEGDAGSSILEVMVSLSVAPASEAGVDYTTDDGTAVSGVDYETSQGRLTFSEGVTSALVTITIIGDELDEDEESLSLIFSNPDNISLTTTMVQGIIMDDDEPPEVMIDDAEITEGDEGTSLLVFNLRLSAPSGRSITVDFATEDDTATVEDNDYEALTGTLTIDPGSIGGSIEIQVNGDEKVEDNEILFVNLLGGTHVSIADDTAEGRVFDNDGPALSGLSSRRLNLTCIAPERPVVSAVVNIDTVFSDLPVLSKPVSLVQAPGDPAAWYVAQQDGVVLRFSNSADVSSTTTFIDISDVADNSSSETGLLGIAFHPDYASNGFVYLSYTETGFTSVLARYQRLNGGQNLDPGSEVRLLTMGQPYSNHNGGHISFGPDGYLYFSLGDGGFAGDPDDRAQNTNNLFGTMLRIDVNSGSPYGIPADNPFFNNPLCDSGSSSTACPEIYAWGLRNPWRWHFDAATGELWLGDVGQDSFEEIDIIESGGNYGWRCREGMHDFNSAGVCPDGLVDPVIEYDANEGNSVTGGFVYRGSAIPELTGRYVFADFERGRIFASVADGFGGYDYEVLLETNLNIVSFAEEPGGELLVLNYGGDIHRIVQGSGVLNNTIANLLSESGCTDPMDATKPYSGLMPYNINAPFWSDGASKERYFAIPDGSTIDVDEHGDWQFPIGSVLVKHFRLVGQLFETRLFMRHTDGSWAGYTYEWNDEGTDAERVVGGKRKTINGQPWIYPSESQCMSCHTQAAGFSLGLEHRQLNLDFNYPESGITANQLVTAETIGLLTAPLGNVPQLLPQLTAPGNTGAGLMDRSRAYLHTNCANCHRPTGPTPADIDLRESTPFTASGTCNQAPISGDLGISGASILKPGDPAASLLLRRAERRDVHGMPPLASNLVDTAGVALLQNWIESLDSCQ